MPVTTIGNASTTASGLAQALDATRPQVQSKRLSFKLGPLGITYATDEVQWTGADEDTQDVADILSGASDGSFATDAASRQTGQTTQATQAEQTRQQETARAFSREMAEALKRQVSEQQTASTTYGPNGELRASAGESAEAGEGIGQQEERRADGAQTQKAAPATRMRRAIAAYLACARGGGSAPMLTTVA